MNYKTSPHGRPWLIVLVSMAASLIAGFGWADTPAAQPCYTRVIITASGPIRYTHRQKNNPPRLEINFISRNIFAKMQGEIAVNQGLIDYVRANYYGKKEEGSAAPLKSLTFYLARKTPYKIIDEGNMIVIKIETPPEILVREISLGKPGGITVGQERPGGRERALLNGIVEGQLKLRNEKAPSAEYYTDPLELSAVETIGKIDSILKRQIPASEFLNLKDEGGTEKASGISIQKPIVHKSAVHRRFNARLIALLMIFLAIFFSGSYMLWQNRMNSIAQKRIELERPWESVKRNLIAHLDPVSPISEAYRGLRTNILSICKERPFKSLLVTSALPDEGKTTVAANLAVSLAHAGSKVLLVDAALRQPLINKVFDLELAPGLVEILTKGLYWTEVIHSTNIENLNIITSGRLPHNPSEILGSRKMTDLLERFKSQFDIILFDSHDVIGITDPVILGSKTDAVLLVIRSRKTQRETVFRAQAILEGAKANVLGCVLSVVNSAVPKGFKGMMKILGPSV